MFAWYGAQWTVLWVSLVHAALIYWALVTMLCMHSMMGGAQAGVTRPVRVYAGDQGI